MKRFLIAAVLVAALGLPACTPKVSKPSAPLPTGQQTAPPPACIATRQAGGQC
jgi:hypothetical protein